MDDLIAVMDAVGSERVAIVGTLEGGPMAATFAATHPDRVSALVLLPPSRGPPGRPATSSPGRGRARRAHGRARRALGRGSRGGGRGAERGERSRLHGVGGWLERLAASPSTIRRPHGPDRRGRWPATCCSTRACLLLACIASTTSFIKIEHYAAPWRSRSWALSSWACATTALAGRREGLAVPRAPDRQVPRARADRMLATVLFTDICDSTRQAEMGDSGRRSLLERHDALFRRALDRHRGREVKRTGDGFLATFGAWRGQSAVPPRLREAMGSPASRCAPASTSRRARGDGRRPRRARGAHRRARWTVLAERGPGVGNGQGLVVGSGIRGPGSARAPWRRASGACTRFRETERYLAPCSALEDSCAELSPPHSSCSTSACPARRRRTPPCVTS